MVKEWINKGHGGLAVTMVSPWLFGNLLASRYTALMDRVSRHFEYVY
ncbi:MAG TPA: hypothetical protein GX523_19480 [Desulfitobacterium dehalogenans]|uniref:Uncharacterized protein n=1 Tax=Desulfitobacterium dehalogenans TaxID=36854 RepID=A0A7C6Z7B1_9FIRM|nr:hypothetical protein [Desulfitobacterium dehalogenans]